MSKLGNLLHRHSMISIAITSALFFFLYMWLSISAPQTFTSPDENTNVFFIRHYSQTGKLYYEEPIAKQVDGYLRPRNTSYGDGRVSPAGFPGFLVIFGTINALIQGTYTWLTPLLAVLGGLFIFLLTRLMAGSMAAIIAFLLALSSTPYWYWSNLGAFNNIAATVFFIGGITFGFYALKREQLGFYLVAGICLGVDAFIRLDDLIFLLPLLVALAIARPRINYKYFNTAVLALLVTVSPLFIINKMLYGGFLSTGYGSVPGTHAGGAMQALIGKLLFYLLPSGFHPSMIVFSVRNYLLTFGPLLLLFGVLGVYRCIRSDKIGRAWGIYFAVLFLWLVVYFGSGTYWGVTGFTMDASYIRYFLPLFLLILPFTAKILAGMEPKIAMVVVVFSVTLSAILTFSSRNGLLDMQYRHEATEEARQVLLSNTTSNSVIVTTYADKYIFPERKILSYGPSVREFGTNKKIFAYDKLAKYISVLHQHYKNVYVYDSSSELDAGKLTAALSSVGAGITPSSGLENLYDVGSRK